MHFNSLVSIDTDICAVGFFVVILCCITLCHIYFSSRADGLAILVSIMLLSLNIEEASIHILGTHCHAESLIMISKCSSLNSVAIYIPWLYSCWAAGRRVAMNTDIGKYCLVGTLSVFYSILYELSASNLFWVQWDAERLGLQSRMFGIPIRVIWFEFAIGFFFAFFQDFRKRLWFYEKRDLHQQMNLWKMCGEIFIGAFLIPFLAAAFEIVFVLMRGWLDGYQDFALLIFLSVAAAVPFLDKFGYLKNKSRKKRRRLEMAVASINAAERRPFLSAAESSKTDRVGAAVASSSVEELDLLENAPLLAGAAAEVRSICKSPSVMEYEDLYRDWLLLSGPILMCLFTVSIILFHAIEDGHPHLGLWRLLKFDVVSRPYRLALLLDALLIINFFCACCCGAGKRKRRAPKAD